MLKKLLKQYVKALIEAEQLDEFSSLGAGSIQGYTLPLGAEPVIPTVSGSRKRKKKKRK